MYFRKGKICRNMKQDTDDVKSIPKKCVSTQILFIKKKETF